MKNKLTNIFILLIAILSLISCEDELEDKYYNPEKSTEPSIPGFFTAMLNNDRVRPNYWNVRTFLLPQTAVYSQTAFFMNSNSMYQQNGSYAQQYWNNFYVNNSNGSGVLSTYRAMQVTFDQLSDAEKEINRIFLEAAKVVLVEQAAKMVDMWGDIPYSEAGSLETSSAISNAKFDDQQELYQSFISDLESAANYFSSVATNSSFSKYDILLSGDVEMWQKYANSLKLRYLMRISDADEGTAKAKVNEMLVDNSSYPLIDGNNSADYNPSSTDVLLEPLTTYTDNLTNALTELPSHYAPDFMLNKLLVPSEDPRTKVLFDKYGRTVEGKFVQNEDFKAMPITFTSGQQESEFAKYAIVDSTTFLQNPALPGILMTAAEVNFNKAEAFEKWGGGNAQEAYETAVKQSITFYYYLNKLNTTGLVVESSPSSEQINSFLENPRVSYIGDMSSKLKKVWEQKWLHYGFLQSIEAWSLYRRTGVPELEFPEATLSGYQDPPVRLLYPADEATYNNSNYQEVASEDTRNTKIFWDIE
ncbi:SusD/RagB family nutrient-binding outer membrane lipoprotein [Zunongwangia pacifica]|uniref:SusD/RagB family nutrient-binding outer membrane lipoprotein n=1 Tax=Zunongwangia pacifica TaxID=2911062 RepID=A0A9X1ZPN3_9FLAO|nr:SusD/RagB family nutrient-binding outer membrane lipoprotein [Zunongwangia pacifica]MCL6218682.1 SusD/RagB family nutrient-binding outer membrane lipoprotein [Zunongwangia pacifica]